jgi:uncharacterized membrane protein YdbT with pleckstrin-like domain
LLASTSGWYTWVGVAVGVIAVVVFLVMAILTYAYRIAAQAVAGQNGMKAATANTNAVWRLRDINRSTTGVWRAAEAARKVLGG